MSFKLNEETLFWMRLPDEQSLDQFGRRRSDRGRPGQELSGRPVGMGAMRSGHVLGDS